MVYEKLRLAAFTAIALIAGTSDAQMPRHQPRAQVQYHSPNCPNHPLYQFQHSQFFQPQQPIQYQTWPHMDQLMQAQAQSVQAHAEKLPLPVNTLEFGFYLTVIERKDRFEVLGGLENRFKIEFAAPGGYVKPNHMQTTSWDVNRAGIYDLYAVGFNKELRLGVVQLDVGDRINFVKISSEVNANSPTVIPNQLNLSSPHSH